MDPSAKFLSSRSEQPTMVSSTAADLLIVLLVLVLVSLLCGLALYFLRRRRLTRKQASELPVYNEKFEVKDDKSHRRRLSGLILSTASFRRQSKPIFVYKEKQLLEDGIESPLPSPLPEIRITFPDEVDDSGKRNSGRVYVVRVGEQGALGLEPLDDSLPSYQKDHMERFQSLDLERIGGLKEKMPPAPPAKP